MVQAFKKALSLKGPRYMQAGCRKSLSSSEYRGCELSFLVCPCSMVQHEKRFIWNKYDLFLFVYVYSPEVSHLYRGIPLQSHQIIEPRSDRTGPNWTTKKSLPLNMYCNIHQQFWLQLPSPEINNMKIVTCFLKIALLYRAYFSFHHHHLKAAPDRSDLSAFHRHCNSYVYIKTPVLHVQNLPWTTANKNIHSIYGKL